ncbi:MAG: hypothetical protein Q4G30_08660 [Actinomycetaceae bacterium]|nr:hypothetical protein [Actinomycetaceae bacterium]
MTDNNPIDPTLAQRAADPATSPSELQQLAGYHPELHAIIAQNPSAYDGLLQWLSAQGNPEVNAIIAQRQAGVPAQELPRAEEEVDAVVGQSPAQELAMPQEDSQAYPQEPAGTADSSPQMPEQETVTFAAPNMEPTPYPAQMPESQAPYGQPQAAYAQPMGATGPGAPGGPASGYQPQGYPQPGMQAAAPKDPAKEHQKKTMLMVIAIAVVALLAVLGVIIGSALMGGGKKAAAPDKPTTSASATKTSPAPTKTETDDPAGPLGADGDLAAPPPDGYYMDEAFVTQDGLTRCRLDGSSVTCTTNQFDMDAHWLESGECDPATQVMQTMMEAGETFGVDTCENQVATDTDVVFDPGDAAMVGSWVCQAGATKVTCWDVNTGDGFIIGQNISEWFTYSSETVQLD